MLQLFYQLLDNDGRAKPSLWVNEQGRVQHAVGTDVRWRYLVVFFIYKLSREALILSARDMDDKERRSYAR